MTPALSVLLAVQAAAPPAGAPQAPDVVVVGRSLADTGEALRRCVERHCPPKEDIDASLAHAENQFIAGDVHGARGTLVSSRRRNKRFARELPVPVAELLRVDALVASLVGEPDYSRIGTIDSVSALKAGLPIDDPKIAAQRLLVAGVFAREGRLRTATNMYDAVAERAGEMGWGAIQGDAMYRAAALYALIASIDSSYADTAKARLAKLGALRDPAAKPYADAAVLIQLKVATLSQDHAALEAARSRARTLRADRPMLIFQPPIDLGDPTSSGGNVQPQFDMRDQWIDFSFTIAPDGRVRDVEEIGRGQRAGGRWIDVARASLSKREYVPLNQPADGAGIAQVERAMFVSDLTTATNSRMRFHGGPPKLQFVPMTATARATPPPVAPPSG